MVPLQPVERGIDLGGIIAGGGGALHFRRVGALTDAQADAAAEVEQCIKDCLDIWGDLEPLARRKVEQEFEAEIDSLRTLGMSVSGGTQALVLRFGDGAAAMPLAVSYVVVAPGEAIRYVLREKPIQLL